VGYVGAIAEWFDHLLLGRVAGLMPEAEFHLCGAVTAPGPLSLRDHANVTLHGEVAYADVPGFLAAMDVLVIPFRLDPIILACDPVKFYEYAAMGKPVVATPMPELARAGDLLWRADTAESFAAAIREAAQGAGDPSRSAALRAFASANAWESRADAALSAMTAEPRVSVVVLSYGDPDLTLAALHSLLGDGGSYPALEVIVVDNGSTQAALDRIAEFLSRHAGVRLIAAGQNLGFAAGNNLGIRAAQGDFVMLLNNDTFVPPGAIRAMVGHLRRNRGIGVVGPLTNNIGNEARVAVDYADMAEMQAAARMLTAGYRGLWTEIPVTAYFCAVFRRDDLARFGLLDPAYGRGMFEDDDHCAAIRAQGLTCALAEDAFVHHHLSASFDRMAQSARQELFARNRAIFESRWGPWVPHRYRDHRPPGTLGPLRPGPVARRRSLAEAA
jgi:GT2 family glycosyltransferase